MELSSANGSSLFRFIQKSAGGADFDAGAAEDTIRFFKGRGDGAYIDFIILVNKSQSTCLLQILTGSYTTQTADTEVVIEVYQGFVVYDRKVPGDIAADILLNTDIPGDFSQFAIVEYGATTLLFRYIAGALG
jgi:hypothetical protein